MAKKKEINADDVKTTIPKDKIMPQVVQPLQKVVNKYDFKFRLGFSFGFFSFLISPIILFQSVLLFLFLLTASSGDEIVGLTEGSFLMLTVRMLFYSTLLFIAVNLFTAFMGVLFDKRRLFAVIALVITTVSLVFIFLGPKLSHFSTFL